MKKAYIYTEQTFYSSADEFDELMKKLNDKDVWIRFNKVMKDGRVVPACFRKDQITHIEKYAD